MTKQLVNAAVMMISLVGCSSSATLVRKDQAGGRVALQGPYMPAMGDARVLMTAHCRGRYQARELGQSVEFECRRGSAPAPLVAERSGQPAPVALAAAGRVAR